MHQKNGLKIAKKLNKIWVSASVFEKHKLQHLLFPEGFTYDKQKKRVLTFRTNAFFHLTYSLSKFLAKK
jgi:hypothetical protein